MYKPTLMNFCPSISSQTNRLLGVVRENKFSYERVEEHHDFILPNDTIGCLWFTHSATHPMIWCLLFLLKKTLRKKIIAFFELKSSVQFLKHCYSIPGNRKLTSFKIIEGNLRASPSLRF